METLKTRYLEIEDRTEDLRDLMRDQKVKARDFLDKFELSLLYHENALEGVVYSSTELMAALDPTAVATDAAMVPVLTEIRNHKAALDLIRDEAKNKKATNVTLTLIKKVYETLGAGIDGKDKAIYRKDMPLHRTYFHDIAQPAKIAPGVEKLCDLTNGAEFKELHPIKQAAQVQWQFMQTFPFTENSGKVARLLAHLYLLRNGYMPVVIHAIDRQRYYESFRAPSAALLNLILEAMENSLENSFKFFQSTNAIRVVRTGSGR